MVYIFRRKRFFLGLMIILIGIVIIPYGIFSTKSYITTSMGIIDILLGVYTISKSRIHDPAVER